MRSYLALAVLLLFAKSAYAYLPLPPAMTALDSPAGQAMFLESNARAAYWPLSAHYETQENQAFCGVASLVMVLNSTGLPAPQPGGFAPYRFFTQEDIFAPNGTGIFQADWIRHHGLTLDQLGQLARHEGLSVHLVHATANGLAQFRTQASAALDTPGRYVIINFNRATIGAEGHGHFSPLAAYDEKTDSFLIMDVARYKFPPAWIDAKALYAALDTADGEKTRGYMIVTVSK